MIKIYKNKLFPRSIFYLHSNSILFLLYFILKSSKTTNEVQPKKPATSNFGSQFTTQKLICVDSFIKPRL